MREQSSTSVKVTWLDYDAVWDAVRRFAQELGVLTPLWLTS